MEINVVNTVEELQSLVTQWEELASLAAEENLNYEPIPLISLLSELEYPGWFVACVWADEKLVGFFPLQSEPDLSLDTTYFASLFKNHFLSCMPLIHKDHINNTLIAFWQWFNSGREAKVFRFSEMLSNSSLANEFLKIGSMQSAHISCLLYTSPSPRDRG